MLAALMLMYNVSDSDNDESESSDYDSMSEEETFPYLLEDEWILKRFHVSREIFKYLHDGIKPTLNDLNGATVYDRLAATLRYLATGTCRSDTGVRGYKAMPRAEFQAMFPNTLNAIRQLICNHNISLDSRDPEDDDDAVRYYRRILGPVRGVAFCATGTHIPIAEPKDQKHLFYYKHGTYSLNALMLCDYKKRIRYVNAGFCGAMHDAHLWNSSGVDSHFSRQHTDGNEWCKVLAHSQFPSKPWIIKPKHPALPNSPEAKFNERHQNALATVDVAVQKLKQRFQCLSGKPPIPYPPSECVAVIDVCCALHNLCVDQNLPDVK